MRAWEKAAKRLTETRTVNRRDITATMNDDRAHGIEPIVANCPSSTVNRYAAVVRSIIWSHTGRIIYIQDMAPFRTFAKYTWT